ncbi:salicylate/benzoate carboxyl methyltransferase-like [Setaria italica]|nr:salicylate/benzoate carboxyl methyltransferase-like [Setaria italica]
MASQGVLAAAKVDSFNEPFYSPCLEELRGAVEQEGSFEILGLERHGILERGPRGARPWRGSCACWTSGLLVQHFRVEGIGDAYGRAAEERFMGPAAEEDTTVVVLVVSLRRRK